MLTKNFPIFTHTNIFISLLTNLLSIRGELHGERKNRWYKYTRRWRYNRR